MIKKRCLYRRNFFTIAKNNATAITDPIAIPPNDTYKKISPVVSVIGLNAFITPSKTTPIPADQNRKKVITTFRRILSI